MPLIGLKNELLANQLQLIPVKGLPIKTTWNLTWLRDKKTTPVANAFINYLQKEKKSIIAAEFNWLDGY